MELCCGGAPLTLRLLGGPHAVPPAPNQGGKRKFAGAILDALGLRAGQGAAQVTLCDAGPWADVWRYVSQGIELQAFMGHWNQQSDEGQRLMFTEIRDHRLERMDGPEAAAAWLWLQARSYGGKGPAAGVAPRKITMGPRSNHGINRYPLDAPAHRLRQLAPLRWAPTRSLRCDVREVEPVPGAVVYLDPPYQGTTLYDWHLERDEVLELALRHEAVGAVVVVSEAEPLPLPGWHHLEITKRRTGTPRNRSRQQAEWLTMSRAPVRPPEQLALL
jgi:hypothetical protein